MLCFQLVTEGDTNEKKSQGLTVRSVGGRTANELLLWYQEQLSNSVGLEEIGKKEQLRGAQG